MLVVEVKNRKVEILVYDGDLRQYNELKEEIEESNWLDELKEGEKYLIEDFDCFFTIEDIEYVEYSKLEEMTDEEKMEDEEDVGSICITIIDGKMYKHRQSGY